MHIDIIGYREWARKVFELVKSDYTDVHFHDRLSSACQGKYTTAFFVGWSDIVPESYWGVTQSFVVHPSPLPYYRGGSPIQHQIMWGETVSAVTIFKLVEEYPEVDTGPIAVQIPYSLEGSLKEVLGNITLASYRAILDVLYGISNNSLALLPQIQNQHQTYKRRTPEESEITLEELKNKSAKWLYNKIRALQDPYPNAFINDKDGNKLFITGAHLNE